MLSREKKITIKINKTNLDYFLEKGYDAVRGKNLEIDPTDLVEGSHKKVSVVCDYCGKNYEKEFRNYLKARETVAKDACLECCQKKKEDVLMAKHGVKTPFSLTSVREKSRNTVKDKYGVDNVMQIPSVVEKLADTLEERYGHRGVLQNPEFLKKARETNLKNHGTESMLEKTLVRVGKYQYFNGVRASKNQVFLSQELEGELNVLTEEGYFLDIVVKGKVVVEYNGSGHDLRVKLGKVSKEEFSLKEAKRREDLLKKGLYLLEIDNPKDLVLTPTRLLEIRTAVETLSRETSYKKISF